ncbi:MAG: DsbA family protein [Acidimicrobiia bacterium]|nr:DsbA family protein [Acidimicrobiia bacterium]MDX2466776.1 DsbA family protein [Acidimicrobiia bacterium]
MRKPEVIYVGDPMCSWCWGIAPAMHQISERSDVDMRIIVGGLRPGPNARALDNRMREELAHHWAKVAEVSGQPFNDAVLARADWVYDTERPAIAVTTMRRHSPADTLRFFTLLQQAFYAEAVDITELSEYRALLAGFDVDIDRFIAEMDSADARTLAWEEFADARELGVAGFPTVLLRVDDTTQVLARGYATSQHFDDLLTYWVEGRQPNSANVGTCSIEGIC